MGCEGHEGPVVRPYPFSNFLPPPSTEGGHLDVWRTTPLAYVNHLQARCFRLCTRSWKIRPSDP